MTNDEKELLITYRKQLEEIKNKIKEEYNKIENNENNKITDIKYINYVAKIIENIEKEQATIASMKKNKTLSDSDEKEKLMKLIPIYAKEFYSIQKKQKELPVEEEKKFRDKIYKNINLLANGIPTYTEYIVKLEQVQFKLNSLWQQKYKQIAKRTFPLIYKYKELKKLNIEINMLQSRVPDNLDVVKKNLLDLNNLITELDSELKNNNNKPSQIWKKKGFSIEEKIDSINNIPAKKSLLNTLSENLDKRINKLKPKLKKSSQKKPSSLKISTVYEGNVNPTVGTITKRELRDNNWLQENTPQANTQPGMRRH